MKIKCIVTGIDDVSMYEVYDSFVGIYLMIFVIKTITLISYVIFYQIVMRIQNLGWYNGKYG